MNLHDPAIFARAYDEHARIVYATAYRVLNDASLAQDVVQDVFLRVWRRPGSFDPSRGSLATYLRLMARSRAVDVWREHQAAGRAADKLKAEVAVAESSADLRPTADLELAGDAEALRAAVSDLPEAQREAVVLAYWGGLTAEQIAARMQIPLGTAKSRLRLALGKLRLETGDLLAA